MWLNSPEVAGQVVAGVFALALLAGAAGMWARRSVVAASVVGVLLVADVGGLPFYERSSWTDRVIQGCFAVVGVVGIVAWVNVLRERRARLAA